MKRLLLSLAVFGLCFIRVFSQEIFLPDGYYVFKEASILIKNSHSQEVVEHQQITDTALINYFNPDFQNMYLALKIEDGKVRECIMSDHQKYYVLDNVLRITQGDLEKEQLTEEELEKYKFEGHFLSLFLVEEQKGQLTFTYPEYTFGQSNRSFTMRAEPTLIMIKTQNNETNNQ